ncbi:MAG: hypothetical protein DRH24_16085 [Deltaproteobacteria bacterium]|nr:MAG: hypothetical protein DRH24_16085 [Deltaproteobacteria bacterium]
MDILELIRKLEEVKEKKHRVLDEFKATAEIVVQRFGQLKEEASILVSEQEKEIQTLRDLISKFRELLGTTSKPPSPPKPPSTPPKSPPSPPKEGGEGEKK